ncbi:hypothetical protein [Spirosoma lituiforme]
MLHQLTQVTLMIHAAEKIKEQQILFRQLIQLDGHASRFHSDLTVGATLYNHSLLLCSSILDEFNTEFTSNKHPEFATRILNFRRQVKPITKRIDKWKDFKTYRNQILAHNLRINGKPIFSHQDKSLSYNIPFTNNEIKLLSELLALITMNIGVEFPELTERLNWKEQINDKMVLDLTDIDFASEYKVIGEEIRKLGLTMTQRPD